jgi:hypothetical protein
MALLMYSLYRHLGACDRCSFTFCIFVGRQQHLLNLDIQIFSPNAAAIYFATIIIII